MSRGQSTIFLRIGAGFATFVVHLGSLTAVIGFGFIGYQCILWLRDGYWTPIPISVYFPQDPWADWTGAVGIKRIIDWLYDLPVSWSLIVIGTICMGIAALAHEAFDARIASKRTDY